MSDSTTLSPQTGLHDEPGNVVNTTRQTFPVTGMSCASCAASIQSILQTQPGVVAAGVNYANGTAFIEYDPGVGDSEAFRQAVQSVGFDLITDESDEAADALETLRLQGAKNLRRHALLSLIFSIPLGAIGMFFMDMPYAPVIMWALATPVVLVFGRQFFINA